MLNEITERAYRVLGSEPSCLDLSKAGWSWPDKRKSLVFWNPSEEELIGILEKELDTLSNEDWVYRTPKQSASGKRHVITVGFAYHFESFTRFGVLVHAVESLKKKFSKIDLHA